MILDVKYYNMATQVNFISSTSLNFHDKAQYYSIQLIPHDNTSSSVQDSTITTSVENEEPCLNPNVIKTSNLFWQEWKIIRN